MYQGWRKTKAIIEKDGKFYSPCSEDPYGEHPMDIIELVRLLADKLARMQTMELFTKEEREVARERYNKVKWGI